MNGDRLIVTVSGKTCSIDTAYIAGVMEVSRPYVIPGASGPGRVISGIVSLRGEPVALVDLGAYLGGAPRPSGISRVIVVRHANTLLGIDVGSSAISFVWAGRADSKDLPEQIDIPRLFEDTLAILSSPPGFAKKRVLVTDDAPVLRARLKDILTRAGYDVVGEAQNGKEAIELAMKLRPDIVTLDVVMPVMTGLEAAKEISSLGLDIKIVMCTSMGHELVVEEAMSNGASAFVMKPIEEKAVLNAFRNLDPRTH